MEKIIFDKPFLKIISDAEKELIHLRWINYSQSEEFREGLMFALDYVNKHKIKRWLANLRDMSIIKESDRTWTNEVWFPEIAKTELKKMAILVSMDFLNQSSVTRIMNKAEEVIQFKTEYFNDIDRARDWLMEKN